MSTLQNAALVTLLGAFVGLVRVIQLAITTLSTDIPRALLPMKLSRARVTAYLPRRAVDERADPSTQGANCSCSDPSTTWGGQHHKCDRGGPHHGG